MRVKSPITGKFIKDQFCLYGHDTYAIPRLKYGACRECSKDQVRKYRYKKMYGITVDKFNELFIAQKGSCAICNKHQSELTIKLHVDHCHKTGKVRGLLCSNCNKNLGILENKDFCVKASLYLRGEIQ